MKKIEDVMDHYEWKDGDTMIPNKTLKPAEKDRILEKTLAKAGLAAASSDEPQRRAKAETPASTRRPRRRVWTAAAACVLILAMATVSFAAMALDKNFFDFFHANSPSQQEMLGNLGTLIDKQVSDSGLTLDIREAVGDGNTVNVLFDVIAPEGTVLDQAYYAFSTTMVDLPKNPTGGAGYYFEILPDGDPTDNKITMMLCYSTERDLSGSTMRFQFANLTTPKNQEEIALVDALPPRDEPGTPGDEYDYNKVIAFGNWNIEFPLNYVDASTTINPNADIRLFDGDCKIKQVRFSPISASMTIKGPAVAEYDSNPPADGQYGTTEGEIQVLLKDGTFVTTNGTGTSISGNTFTVSTGFSELIDPADIDSISFNGVTIPISGGK